MFMKDNTFEEVISVVWWYFGSALHAKTWNIVCILYILYVFITSVALSLEYDQSILGSRRADSNGVWCSLVVTYILWYNGYTELSQWTIVSTFLVITENIVHIMVSNPFKYCVTTIGSLIYAAIYLSVSDNAPISTTIFLIICCHFPKFLLFTFHNSLSIGESLMISHLLLIAIHARHWYIIAVSFIFQFRFIRTFDRCSNAFTLFTIIEHLVAIIIVCKYHSVEFYMVSNFVLNLITVSNVALCSLWLFLVSLALGIVVRYQNSDQYTLVTVRKSFHVLAGIVYASGIVYGRDFLSFVSAIVLFLFLILDIIRMEKIGIIGVSLHQYLMTFRDKRDAGDLTFTPIALLLGLAIPVWLSEYFEAPSDSLFSWGGVISVALGDTLSSSVGRRYGSIKWPYSHRSLQGTLSSWIGQILLCLCLEKSEIIAASFSSFWLPVTTNVLAEIYTSQIDNLILPLCFVSFSL